MKSLIIAIVLVAILAVPVCADFTWDSLIPTETSAVLLTANGLGRAGITATYPLGEVYGFNPYLDVILANNGDSGLGVSVGLEPVGEWLSFDKNAPELQYIISRLAVGTTVLNSGETLDAGLYWKLKLVEVKFGG